LLPFVKNETRSSSQTGKLTYSWNNAYQNIKHDRGSSLEFGSIKYLFNIMSALFLLNIYYKADVIALQKDMVGTAFPANLGSSIFSIKLASANGYDNKGKCFRLKQEEFDTATYYVDMTEESKKIYLGSLEAHNDKWKELLAQHPKVIEYAVLNDISLYQGDNFGWDVLGKDEYIRMLNQALSLAPISDRTQFEAILNTHKI
jgi:hypothetical protein